jgi:transposase
MDKDPDITSSQPEEIRSLISRIKQRNLSERDWLLIERLLSTLLSFISLVENKNATIKRLRRMLFGPRRDSRVGGDSSSHNEDQAQRSDTSASAAGQQPTSPQEPQAQTKRAGHGRRATKNYTGARVLACQHPQLKVGDRCPHPHCTGHLYDTHQPSRPFRLIGHPLVTAEVYEQQVLRCSACCDRFTAPLPEGVAEQKWDPSADVALVLSRYGSAVPFHRTAQLQQMTGVPLSSSTQFERCEAVADALLPVYLAIREEASRCELIHADDTPVRILSLLKENEQLRQHERRAVQTTGIVGRDEGYKIALYVSGRRHSGENIKELLTGRPSGLGLLKQVGDAARCNQINGEKTIFVCCWAHARRRFIDIEESAPQICAYVLAEIGELFRHERETAGMSPAERLLFHQQQSGPVISRLYGYLAEQLQAGGVEPSSAVAKALNYLANNRECLTVFLRVAGAPLDNNAAERSLRRVVLWRKNSLFFKTEHGAAVGDLLVSLIETCRLNEVNAWAYLVDAVKNRSAVRKNPTRWLPWNYARGAPLAEAA